MDSDIPSHRENIGCSCSFFKGTKTTREYNSSGTYRDPDDEELARELNELSFQEREQVFDEIHGVAETYEETPEFVSKVLKELDSNISHIPKQKRRAYDRAVFFRPSIQNDAEFKMMFLRADSYDAEKAAKRLLKHYEDKLQLFGEEKLAKDITLDDLSEEDMEVFSTGWCLELPHRDQVGRPIWFFDVTRYDFDRPESMIRCAWYRLMLSLQDEVAQSKGVCNILYAPGSLLAITTSMVKVRNFVSKVSDVLVNLPMRITSYHFCYNDPRMKFLLSCVRALFGKQIRLRIRTHYGSDLEMQYSLTTFGIPCHQLLVQTRKFHGEDTKRQLHELYVQRRREIEAQAEAERQKEEQDTGIILYPQPNDVLIGRGRPYQEFPGNQRFSQLIDSNLTLYHKGSDRFGKTCLSMDIVKTIQEQGGRYIERTKEGSWKVINDMVAREKTAIAFRSRVFKVSSDENTASWRVRKSKVDTTVAKRLRYDPTYAQS